MTLEEKISAVRRAVEAVRRLRMHELYEAGMEIANMNEALYTALNSALTPAGTISRLMAAVTDAGGISHVHLADNELAYEVHWSLLMFERVVTAHDPAGLTFRERMREGGD